MLNSVGQKPVKGDTVKVLRNTVYAHVPDSDKDCALEPGDTVVVAEVVNGHFGKERGVEDVVLYERPKAICKDRKANKAYEGFNFIPLCDVELVSEICKCDVWAGCTCGVFKREQERKKLNESSD